VSVLDQQGFEINPDVLNFNAVFSIIAAIESSTICRSRAGMRHALEIDAVRLLATDRRLLQLARNALGERALPFRATLLKNLRNRTGWLYGIRTPHCR
jgi:hypothetical protein